MSLFRLMPRVINLQASRSGILETGISPLRNFTTTPPQSAKPLPPRLKLLDSDLSISYLKGTGPGGQKINKTNSAVQIIHKPTGIVIKSQATRSQSQNEKIARSLLADRVEEHLFGESSRVALKAEVAKKKKASKVKKAKRKYRGLERENGDVNGDGGATGGIEELRSIGEVLEGTTTTNKDGEVDGDGLKKGDGYS
ncbi:peptide chain release factor-like protein [Penicillium citrinum]|uniref:Peptide chain release factor-like protein n=1 Tax=Penicillium citrinum TaxID=5077 RepID=A0A9W9PDP1_PENCI|nr:peptide chain release factor-like protein [Penicillium citrinum]KAJ5242112.1 peptide chain release factor-like protein [Penicillium citrinum]